MAYALIIVLTIANVMTAFYCLKHYAGRSSILQLCFVIVWTMHYVVGNILILLSSERTYTLSSFEKFEWSYLISLAIGQYFLWTYLFLLDLTNDKVSDFRPLRADSRPVLLAVFSISLAFALWFIWNIGLGAYFSQELAQYRARLGDYAGEGIGIYYYLASFLLPATILLGAYATAHPAARNLIIFAAALIIALLVFVPLGGRGRAINIIVVLVLNYMVLRGRFRITSIAHPRTIMLLVGLVAVSYIWGMTRDRAGSQVVTDLTYVMYSLSIDTTRLSFQSFIFDTYPPSGVYFGVHYLESLLGPFYSFTGLEAAGLISDLSARWYYETIFGYNVRSAISPSLIGETYLNFGITGVLFAPVFLFLIVRGANLLGGRHNALCVAVVIYFVQFNLFHGGLYSMFDMLVMVLPILLFARFFSTREVRASGAKWPRGQGTVSVQA